MAADVVVEIGVYAACFFGLFFEPFCPFLQLGFRVAACISAGRAVEADVNDIGGDHAGRFFAGHVVDAEADAQFTKQLESIIAVPAFVPEFKDGSFSLRQQLDKSFEQVEVFVQAGRQLIQNRAERAF